jgi:transposase
LVDPYRMNRRGYPSDVSDEEWALVAPYLTLMREEAPQREHALREVFNGLRYLLRTGAPWRWLPNDLPPWEPLVDGASADQAVDEGGGVRDNGA